MKNNIYKIALVLSAFVLALACENSDDLTGDSVAKPSSPALSVSLDFANSQSLIETEADYAFTVSLSQPQITAVVVYLELQPSSTATEGDDFSFPHSVRIPAGATSVSDVITIHTDDLIEETETASIKIGTGFESNVTATNSETVTFSIMNYTDGDLAVGLDWALGTTITDNFGNEIGVYDAGDLRLLLTDGTNVLDGADGGSAESYVLSGAAPDGVYYIVSDFYDAYDVPVDFDLTLTFDQAGTINGQTHFFPAALNSTSLCGANFVTLAKITKTGTSYAFEEVGERNFVSNTWSGTDVIDAFSASGYASEIVSDVDCDGTFLRGINASWMLNIWGEEIVEEANVYYTVDGSGNVTIESQYIFTTLYSGALYPYTIDATGTLVGDTLTLNYNLDQEGFAVDDWMLANGYMAQDYFIATVTKD